MIAGCVFLGGGLAVYSFATQPWHIYLCHSLLGLSLGLVGVMMQTVLIAGWFRRRRGLAMGIVLTGTSIGGVIVPIISRPLIVAYGWRSAMLIVGSVVWLVLLPAIVLGVKEKPADAEASGELALEGNETTGGLTLREAMRTRPFWILALCAASIFYPIFTTSQQFILHIQKSPSIGVDAGTASLAQSFLFATSVGGKFLFGWLSDRLRTTRVMLICCGV